MISWLKSLITSRYVKSAVRYLIAMLVVYLNKDYQVPMLGELLTLIQSSLVEFLEVNQEQLVSIITAILMGWLGTWTVVKNKANAKLEKKLKERGITSEDIR